MDKMEQEAFSPLLEDFLLSPLVCWVGERADPCRVASRRGGLQRFISLSVCVFVGEDGLSAGLRRLCSVRVHDTGGRGLFKRHHD